MTQIKTETRVALAAIATLGGMLGGVLLLLIVAERFDLAVSRGVLIRLYSIILLAGGVYAGLFMATLVTVGWVSRLQNQPFSRLYPPILALVIGIAIVFGLSAAGAYVRLRGDTWPVLAEPEVRLFNAVAVALAVGATGWATIVILRGRGWPVRAVAFLIAGAAVVTGLLLTLAAWG